MRSAGTVSLFMALIIIFSSVALCSCGDGPAVPGGNTEASAEESGPNSGDETVPVSDAPDTGTGPDLSKLPAGTARRYELTDPSDNQFVIIYDFNGGRLGDAVGLHKTVKDSATGKIRVSGYEGCLVQTVTNSHYICPHSLGNEGYFARDGYVLYGYNTEPDGSGEFFGCGWNVPVGLGEKRILFAMWAKEPDAEDMTVFQNQFFKKYSGSEKTVAVPEGITAVYAYAFSENENVETVILPKSVTKLEPRAFYNCPNLKNVYMYDLITSMTELSFEGCGGFSKLYINNANKIKYLGGMKQGSYMCKFQRLKVMEDKKKIILVGGSNLCYGLDSALLKELLDGEYEIINWGTMYYLPSVFFIDVASHFITDGDILVTCPEEEPVQWGQIWVSGEFSYSSFLFYSCEGCMEVFSYVDMVKYRKLLPSIAKCNAERATGTFSYESYYAPHSVNQYGDFDDARTQTARKKTDSFGKKSGWSNTGYLNWIGETRRSNFFTQENVANLNESFASCVAKGGKVFISFSVTDEYYFSDASDETVKAYEDDIIKNYVTGHEGVRLISSFRTYLFDDSKFYNSMHHLLWEPAQERTRLLYNDISGALK